MSPRRMYPLVVGLATIAVFFSTLSPVFARSSEGKLRVTVSPKNAYVFVDGAALKEGDCKWNFSLCTIYLSPGEHTVEVHNYGYTPETKKVNLEAGRVTNVKFNLSPSGGPVSPPWGRLIIQGPSHAAVLLNGKTPDYFVAHVNETHNHFLGLFKETLVVPPGSQKVTVTWFGHPVWTGTVNVPSNKAVQVDINKNGAVTTQSWPDGRRHKSLPRFQESFWHTTVAVAPVSGQISANPSTVSCGDSSTVSWSSKNTVAATVSNIGNVATSGSQSVSPKQTTTYDLSASGPGGVASSSATVNVNSAINATLTAEPTEVRYHKRGDQVIESGSTTLTWSTSGAQSVSIDPIGTVGLNGSQTVTPTPTDTTTVGPVNQDVTYTLHASNDCGGSATQTATVHITGVIEPAVTTSEVEAVLTSVFFPTAYPGQRHPDDGLLASQKAALDKIAAAFTKFHDAVPEAQLSLEAHADVRGSLRYNQALSERRADIVKNYLVSKGVPEDAIVTHAFGKTEELDLKQVRALEAQNPQAVKSMRRWYLDVLAENRRVDIVLMPAGKRSTPYYPHNAPDAGVLYQYHKPPLSVVRKDE